MLERLLDDVRSSSEGRLVLVGGEAGVGKTTLLLVFCRRQGAAAQILWGGCEPLRTPRPLGALLDVAEETGGPLVGLVEGVARPYEVAAGLIRELGRRGPTVLEASSATRGFEWGDAGLGAAGTLVLLGTGAGSAAVIARRRGHRTAVS
jgi:hypothetical protein